MFDIKDNNKQNKRNGKGSTLVLFKVTSQYLPGVKRGKLSHDVPLLRSNRGNF